MKTQVTLANTEMREAVEKYVSGNFPQHRVSSVTVNNDGSADVTLSKQVLDQWR